MLVAISIFVSAELAFVCIHYHMKLIGELPHNPICIILNTLLFVIFWYLFSLCLVGFMSLFRMIFV